MYIKISTITSDAMNEPPLKKQRVHPTQLQSYITLLNAETAEFFQGQDTMGIPQTSSRISCLGSRTRKEESGSLLGSHWSSFEKNKFFTFLGRYGIQNIDKLQKAIGTKSILEIRTYYDLLKKNLDKYQRSRKRFAKLCTYDEIPFAIEVDELVVEIEETLARSVDEKMDDGNNNNDADNDAGNDAGNEDDKDDNDNDNENQLINYGAMRNLLQFYVKLKHLEPPNLIMTKQIKDELYLLTRNFIKKILRNIIIATLQRGKHEYNDQAAVVVLIKDILRAVFQIESNRPLTIHRIIQNQGDKLDYQLMDNYEAREGPDVIDGQGRVFHHMIEDVSFEGLTDRYSRHYDGERADYKVDEPFISSGTKFINDHEEDSLLDDFTAWYLTSMETEELSVLDMQSSREEQWRYLDFIGMTDCYQVKQRQLKEALEEKYEQSKKEIAVYHRLRLRMSNINATAVQKKLDQVENEGRDEGLGIRRDINNQQKETEEDKELEEEYEADDDDIDSDFHNDIFLEESEDGMELTREQQLLFGYSFP